MALVDLRSAAMSISPERMQVALTEYSQRRETFREWLKRELIQGVHYGYPPGVSPSKGDAARWQSKPSLYKAGAEFVVDLMGLRSEFTTDLDAWTMLGKKESTIVRTCRLYSRATGELIGQGTGAREVGDKRMNLNASIKMADKSALVAAVINSYGLSDLFTQDIEEDKPQRPARKPSTVTSQMLRELMRSWATATGNDPSDKGAFLAWASNVTGINDLNILASAEGWQPADVEACWQAIED